jgi:two-component system, NtrC family, response regulator AtoC
MSKGTLKLLVVEDELELRIYLEMALRCLGYKVELAQDGVEALAYLQSSGQEVEAVLLDLIMPNRDGLEALREIRQLYPDLPVIILSGAPSPLNIVKAMKSGATDFLCKPVTHEDLREAITRALDVKTVECLRPLKSAAGTSRTFIGTSPRMRAIHSVLAQVGWSEAPVLIQGETGSGKEMIARELHAKSPRAKKAFFKLNCAALPSELVESELFGYERGAFTGAFQRKPGMFETADGGTILLDEIGDMDVRLQAKLLQVLQDHEFQRIGGKDTIKVDVRVIAATHRDLERAIQDRLFREDLYYRINVVTLHVPPLRDRKEDIVALTEFLQKKHIKPGAALPTITPELRTAMLNWSWPGNVRELENFARKLLIFEDPAAAARELYELAARKPSLAGVAAAARASSEDDAEGGVMPILAKVTKAKQQAEADAILNALNTTRWNRKQAAALLQIDYKALLYKMKKLGVDDKPPASMEEDIIPPKVMKTGGAS